MQQHIAELIDRIAELPSDWHGAGTVNANGLRAIAAHAQSLGPIRRSVETGSGKTTLLFSHLSEDHRVFAVDDGNSISQVRSSPLFKSNTVTYIEGPTQLTLPRHQFTGKVQIALIDGPHGYPFPDLEYFYFYPLIETGGLLLVDDLPIPSIARMFEIIKADDMFELVDVVNDNMAFFRRTQAPLISPHGDGWWLQGYNRAYYEKSQTAAAPTLFDSICGPVLKRALRGVAALAPQSLKKRIPSRVKKRMWTRM